MLKFASKLKNLYQKFKETKQSSLKKVFIDDVYEVERLLNKKVTKKSKKTNNSIFNKVKKMKIVT